MKPIVIFLSICIAASVFVAHDASAGMRAYAATASPAAVEKPTTTPATAKSDVGKLKAARRSHGAKKTNKKPRAGSRNNRPKATRTAARPRASQGAALASRKAIAREHAESEARSELIYQSSQSSAPIITDATACKHIGSHGGTVYENCELTSAANAADGM